MITSRQAWARAIARIWAASIMILGAVFCGASGSLGAPVLIRISTQTPITTQSNQTFRRFKERVEAASAGEIRVEIHDAAKLFRDDQIADAIAEGKVEMGYVVMSRYAAKIPSVDVFQLPFLFNTDAVAAAARAPGSEIRRLIDNAILEQAHSRALWWVPQGQNVLLSTVSLADPDALSGKTVRTFGPMMESFVQHCGGKHKEVGGPEQAKAYQSRIVDVGMAGVSTMMERNLYESMNIVTRTNHATVEVVAAMNEAFFQSLSGGHKAILLDAAKAADAEAAQLLADNESSAYKVLADKKLATVVPLTSDQLELWRICSSDVLTDFLDQAGSLGHELMSAYGRLRLQPCCNKSAE